MAKIMLVAAGLCYLAYTGTKLIADLHMIQQNSYMNRRYVGWIRHHPGRNLPLRDLLPLAALLPLFLNNRFFFSLVWLVFILLLFFFRPRRQEKKKLVMTARATRLFAAALLVLALLALPGFYLLGFREMGIGAGAGIFLFLTGINALSFLLMLAGNILMFPVEAAVNRRYYRDARRRIREMPGLTVVGLTGSFGKTSTKHILTRILSDKYQVLTTPGSFNTPMGVTKVIRTMLKPVHEIFVVEMGAKQRGDIRALCRLVSPRFGLLTAIGEQHLETFKSLENIKNTKFELIESLPENGAAFFNLDDANIRDLASRARVKSVFYGLDRDDAHYAAENVQLHPGGTRFDIRTCRGERAAFQTKLLGRHNISNILAAAAVACELGMDLAAVARAVRSVEPVPHRLALRRTGQNVTIIDDAFNSNPVGSRMALEVLDNFPGARKIMVTPGMIELGEREYEINRQFAVEAAKVCDHLILVGRKHTRPLQEGLKSAAFPDDRWYAAADLTDANRHLQSLVRSGDVVLFENDLPDTYNE